MRGTSGTIRLALARRPVVRRVRDRELSGLLSRERVQLKLSTAASQLRGATAILYRVVQPDEAVLRDHLRTLFRQASMIP